MAVVRSYLILTDAIAPLEGGPAAIAAASLGRELAASGAETTVVALGAEELAAAVPGLARRLRTVPIVAEGQSHDLPLFEGRTATSSARVLVLGHGERNRTQAAVLLASGARALVESGLLKADMAIGWGETAALALWSSTAAVKLFVVPSGRLGPPLTEAERSFFGALGLDRIETVSLAAIGTASAQAIVAPSPTAARLLDNDPGLALRASDEPFIPIRFGCDDAPFDPETDPVLPARYTAKDPAGKQECRRMLGKQHALSLGPRTLLLSTAPLRRDNGGEVVMAALPQLAGIDAVTVVPAAGDADLLERMRVLAIEVPGRFAVVGDDATADNRLVRAAADAVLIASSDDRTGRDAGLALRYGTLPVTLAAGAQSDFLVDVDPASATGNAVFFDRLVPFEIEAAVRRALVLRQHAETWHPLVASLMRSAPRWASTVAHIQALVGDLAASDSAA